MYSKLYTSVHPPILHTAFWVFCLLLLANPAGVYAQKNEEINPDWSVAAKKIENLLRKLEQEYMEPVDFEKAAENAINGILKDLDPHSVYIPAEEYDDINEPLVGNFEGIGIKFEKLRDTIFVLTTTENGPSAKAGLQSGDKIIAVNNKVIAGVGITDEEISRLLRGPRNSELQVAVKRQGSKELLDYKVVRDKITIPSVEAGYMATPTIAYIKVSRFSSNTMREFTKKLKALKKEGMESLILDLRNNGGGYFSMAVDMADEFLNHKQQIVYTEGENYPKKSYDASSRGNFEQGRLVILINENSASASEIVSGAIQDWDRGIIIGQRSFGKGLVQKPFMFSDSSYIRLTIAHYYTPTGRSIQKPYDKGKDDYYKDLDKRYENGEMTGSISQPEHHDSLKYLTKLQNRVVYGGGGITPDIYVPLDTTYRTAYYKELVNKGILNLFLVGNMDLHRQTILSNYPTEKDFETAFETPDTLLQELKDFAQLQQLPPDEAGFEAAKNQVKLRIKSFFAKYLYSDELNQKVLNRDNETYLKALQVLETDYFWNHLSDVSKNKDHQP
ncbi:MAG: S41 family peptidase [Sphingobacteriales bacterium]|nr:MAG: S41 family peptidase [Sphingobacteriales bacterium]